MNRHYPTLTAVAEVYGHTLVARYDYGPYVDIFWGDAPGDPVAFEAINVSSYATHERTAYLATNEELRAEFTVWLRESIPNRAALQDYLDSAYPTS